MSKLEIDTYFPREYLKDTLGNPAYLPTRSEVLTTLNFNVLYNRDIHHFGRQHRIFEYWTQEYIDAFGNYLRPRIQDIHEKKGDKVTVLEVGAGDGRLSHFLRTRALKDVSDISDVYAVDNGDWDYKIPRKFPVGKLSYQEALPRSNPDIVISSWMIPEEDWTPAFRATPSVKEYLLIGNTEQCGTLDTYGMAPNFTFNDWILDGDGGFAFKTPPDYIPPHRKDGFTMENLRNLGQLQIGFTDCQFAYVSEKNSRTISFRRN